MNERASKEGFELLNMNPKYKHQKVLSYDNLECQGFDLHLDPLNTWKKHKEIRSDKKLSLTCSLLTQNRIFNQLGNAKHKSERSTKSLKSSWQGQKLTSLIQKFL